MKSICEKCKKIVDISLKDIRFIRNAKSIDKFHRVQLTKGIIINLEFICNECKMRLNLAR